MKREGYLQMLIFTDKNICVACCVISTQALVYICTYYESTKNIKLKIIRIGNLIHKLCLIMSIVNTLNNILNFLKIFGKILHPSLLKTKVAL